MAKNCFLPQCACLDISWVLETTEIEVHIRESNCLLSATYQVIHHEYSILRFVVGVAKD